MAAKPNAITGTPFHGEFSGNATTATAITLYGPSSTTPLVIGSTQVVIITDLKVMTGTADTIIVFDGADTTPSNGEIIDRGSYPANGGIATDLTTPHFCQVGAAPQVKSSSSTTVDVTIRGRIFTP